MTTTLRAHFDGKFIVPDEPVSLPRGTPLEVHVQTLADTTDEAAIMERQGAFDEFMTRARSRAVPHLSDDATRREAIYED